MARTGHAGRRPAGSGLMAQGSRLTKERAWAVLAWPLSRESRGRCDLLLQKSQSTALGYGGGAGRDVELGEGVGHVAVDGVFADEQPLGDRLVVEPFGNEAQDLDLPRSQPLAVFRRRGGCRGEPVEQRLGA